MSGFKINDDIKLEQETEVKTLKVSATQTYTLPADAGTAGQVLTTGGPNTTATWQPAGGGTGWQFLYQQFMIDLVSEITIGDSATSPFLVGYDYRIEWWNLRSTNNTHNLRITFRNFDDTANITNYRIQRIPGPSDSGGNMVISSSDSGGDPGHNGFIELYNPRRGFYAHTLYGASANSSSSTGGAFFFIGGQTTSLNPPTGRIQFNVSAGNFRTDLGNGWWKIYRRDTLY